MDEGLLARAKEVAREREVTLTQFIGDLVAREVWPDRGASTLAMFELSDRLGLRSQSGPMGRDETHERA
jgi:hypothetical protein